MKRTRLAYLLQHDLNLFAYHLPLDCHQHLGNNAQLAKHMQWQVRDQHRAGGCAGLLWEGLLATEMSATELTQQLQNTLGRTPLHIAGHERDIKHIAWCTGAAQGFIEQAAMLGVDAFISGEASEQTTHVAREYGIDYFAIGHHASERYGIQALGAHLAEEFSLQHHCVDIANPV